MKRKKLILILLITAFTYMGCSDLNDQTSATTEASDTTKKIVVEDDGIPPRPNPAKAVNDFANIIDDSVEAELENKLVQFENARHIPVVIVTVPYFDSTKYATINEFAYKLFNKWGIGYSGANNGTLLVCSVHPRKIRIEPGKGMEEYLTDASSGRIMAKHMKASLKVDDYNTAFAKGTDGLIAFINEEVPTAEQLLMMKKNKEKEDREAKEAMTNIGMIIVFLIVLFLIGYLIRLAVNSWQARKAKKALQEKARETHAIIDKELQAVQPAIAKAKEIIDTYPVWAQKEAQGYIMEVDRLATSIASDLIIALRDIEDMPQDAMRQMNGLHEKYRQALIAFEKGIKAVPEKVTFFRQQAPIEKEVLYNMLQEVKTALMTYKADGWIIFHDDEAVYVELENAYESLAVITDAKELYDSSKLLAQKVLTQINNMKAELAMQDNNATRIRWCTSQIPAMQEMIQNATDGLHYLRQQAPKNIWLTYEGDIARVTNAVSDLTNRLNQATKHNSKAQQQFVQADALIDSVESSLERNSQLLMVIIEKHDAWITALKKLPVLKKQAADSMKQLLESVKHSDVKETTKKQVKESSKALIAIESVPDITIALGLTNQLINDIRLLERQINDDITSAKPAPISYSTPSRSTKKDNDDGPSIWATTSSRNNDDSGGGFSFGGFGGGESGGGGATMDY